jgi:hypothetical protein
LASRAAPKGAETTEEALYEVRRKIYPRSTSGAFSSWRVWLVILTQLIYYGTPWLQWNDRQAVLFDLGARKFYIFGLVLWPQDVIYLAVLLVILRYRYSCSPPSPDACSAATPVPRRSTQKYSCGSSDMSKGIASRGSDLTAIPGACASCESRRPSMCSGC